MWKSGDHHVGHRGIERTYIYYKQMVKTVMIEGEIRKNFESMVGIFNTLTYDGKFCTMGWKIPSRKSEMCTVRHEHAYLMGLPGESCL
jgi:hypothetical protein